jgi:hypothetical protein
MITTVRARLPPWCTQYVNDKSQFQQQGSDDRPEHFYSANRGGSGIMAI